MVSALSFVQSLLAKDIISSTEILELQLVLREMGLGMMFGVIGFTKGWLLLWNTSCDISRKGV